jgi:hypothetical protein
MNCVAMRMIMSIPSEETEHVDTETPFPKAGLSTLLGEREEKTL